jgi:hypothetical protein
MAKSTTFRQIPLLTMTPDRTRPLARLLAFYAEAGVDAAIGETAKDRLSEPEPACGVDGRAARRLKRREISAARARLEPPIRG